MTAVHSVIPKVRPQTASRRITSHRHLSASTLYFLFSVTLPIWKMMLLHCMCLCVSIQYSICMRRAQSYCAKNLKKKAAFSGTITTTITTTVAAATAATTASNVNAHNSRLSALVCVRCVWCAVYLRSLLLLLLHAVCLLSAVCLPVLVAAACNISVVEYIGVLGHSWMHWTKMRTIQTLDQLVWRRV